MFFIVFMLLRRIKGAFPGLLMDVSGRVARGSLLFLVKYNYGRLKLQIHAIDIINIFYHIIYNNEYIQNVIQ